MPWYVEKREGRFCVVKGERGQPGGETEDCHPTEAAARDHMAALYAAERNMAAKTVDIKDVELLRVGEFNGVPFAREDLAGMVEAFNETSNALPVDLRLGHDARQAFARAVFGAQGDKTADDAAADEFGWPALGWLSALRLSGDKLVGDLTGVPERVAEWIKGGRYRTRSSGLLFNAHVKVNKRVGEKVYRWLIDHLALLGADTPAVSGLADIGLADDGREREIVIFADGGAGGESAQTALDRLVAALSAAMDEHTPLVYGRRGAPMVRQLFAAFLAKLRESARSDLPLSDQGGQGMTIPNGADLRALVNLAADDPPIRVVEALNALDDNGAVRLLTFAAGLGLKTADELALYLSITLGVPRGDFDGVAAKVAELMGGDAPEMPAGPADTGATPPDGGTPMHETKKPAAPAPGTVELSAQMVQLSAAAVKMAEEIKELRAANGRAAAEKKVAADAAARGLSLPKPVHDALVNMAATGDTTVYDAIIANVKGVPTEDKGASKPHALAEIELSATEVKIATEAGVKLDDYRRQKALNMGIEIQAGA